MSATERDGVRVEKELVLGDHEWFVFSEEELGLRMVCLKDNVTGVIVSTFLPPGDMRYESVMAWQGARHSRSGGKPWEIMQQIFRERVNADAKAGAMFSGYGHKSVGDMASLHVEIVGPMHLFFTIFNLSQTNSGQETSTRFQQGFGIRNLSPLWPYMQDMGKGMSGEKEVENAYQDVETLSRELFNKWHLKMKLEFGQYFSIDPTNSSEASALQARSLDVARKFLLLGMEGGMHYENMASDFPRIIGILRGSNIPFYRRFAEQLHMLLVPGQEIESELKFKAQAPSLVRRADNDPTVAINTLSLRLFVESIGIHDFMENRSFRVGARDQRADVVYGIFEPGLHVIASYIWSVFPDLDYYLILDWLSERNRSEINTMSEIVFFGHDAYHPMDQKGQATGLALVVGGSIAVARDINRHRPMARINPIVEKIIGGGASWMDILSQGFVIPEYLSKDGPFRHLRAEYESDMKTLFAAISVFVGKLMTSYEKGANLDVLANLLPLGTYTELVMHANLAHLIYLVSQRVRPGGDADYIRIAYDLAQSLNLQTPAMSGLRIRRDPKLSERGIDLDTLPNPFNKQAFLNRG